MIDFYIVRDIVSWALMITGGIAIVSGAIGLVRFPDFFSRIHAAGVTDTGGAELIIIGMMLQATGYPGGWLLVAKLAFIGAFLFLTSPVATHAIAHAAWMTGFKPMQGKDLRYDGDGK
ncbi:monovalent cation/H(+) antiporter subunit G [Hyphococcus flavus]|uniref:Monovalent cation/H(+) antiporter subunit G n=1 Tax=Hyphococcus flavus TaxID=1866326 RepID=A0AAF0CGD3_9PROT|nr:monovalent cation/H(+) antiporter subunit G [Hyphococcus flavus]WDI32234.1 monovalent cation/H(+) antiporter subunit G [Hyphococcus flavus]